MAYGIDDFLSALSSIGGSIGDVAGSAASGLGDLGSNLWSGILNNPAQSLGAGLSGFNAFAPYLFGGQQDQSGFQGAGLQAQMQQPTGPSPQQVRRQLGNAQAQGLYGASPDFLAQMSGVTPSELDQMLGYNMQRGPTQ